MVSIQLEGNKSGLDSGRAASAGKEMLKQLARTDPYYKRNRPHVCSFFLKGECNRGAECPYRYDLSPPPPPFCTEQCPFSRHEQPVDSALSHQNMQDRYYGRNDPVAHKIMATHAETQGLAPPSDPAIVSRHQPPTAAFNSNFSPLRCPYSFPHSLHPLRNPVSAPGSSSHYLPSNHPKSSPLSMSQRQGLSATFFLYFNQPPTVSRCAFVNFKDRDTAEQAAQAWANGLDLEGVRVAVKWGRSKSTQGTAPKPSPAIIEPSVDP